MGFLPHLMDMEAMPRRCAGAGCAMGQGSALEGALSQLCPGPCFRALHGEPSWLAPFIC